MIITRLIGGLGNQLFQYAVGRHLAELRSTELKIDLSGFEIYKLHEYSLGAFNIRQNFASKEEAASLTVPKDAGAGGVLGKVFGKKAKRAKTHIREKKLFSFDRKVLNLPDRVYLDGYWQCEKYFVAIAEIIRREVIVKSPQTGKDKEVAEMIASCESVSLHVRRGDYVSNPKTNRLHGTCSVDYYHRCVEHVAQMVKNLHFFVFTDDPEWARENMKLPHATTVVAHNDASRNYEDLRLMSQCRHNIIANSSFSWWGAWLNPNEDKMVLAPRRWLAMKGRDCKDIIPGQWVKK
ncbi:MAG: alpha-1,2-fucosyltransferase [bacterium]